MSIIFRKFYGMTRFLFVLAIIANSAIVANAHDFQVISNGVTYWYNNINNKAQITYQGASYESTNQTQYSGNIVIPSRVYYRTNSYLVTSINHHTFWNRRTTSVTIPNSIVEIGSYAFGYSPLNYIKVENTDPNNISVNSNTFFGIDFDDCRLIVPCGCGELYAEAPYWNQFKIIEEFGCDIIATDIILSAQDMTLLVGQTDKLTATVEPENTTDPTITWKSDNEAVATVSADGAVTGISVGTANVTANCGSVTATCKVTVNPVAASNITLSVQDMTLLVGQTDKLTATVEPENTTDPTITWKSDNEAVATVSADGAVTGISVGTANVTANCGSVTATCKITVKPRETKPISVSRSDEKMIILDGESAEMSVNVTGGYPEGLTFTWSDGNNTLGSENSLTVVGLSNGNKKSNKFYSIHVVDVCDGVTLLDETYQFEVETWPRPASDVTIEMAYNTDNIKIREGNMLELSAENPAGGYADNWNFNWYLNGNKVSSEHEMSRVMTMAKGTEMGTEEAVVMLTASNIGPDGTVWGEATSAPLNVTIYRRPLTPKQLLRKGDGTTHTVVAMSQYADTELAPLGYAFVYGYTDADGEDHVVATTAKRYCRLDNAVFDNVGYEKWCYSQWTYADGSVVSSGKRYLDGTADEDFDASDFSGNAIPKKSMDFSDSNNWIRSNGNGINISIETTDEARVEVYSIAGTLIDSVVIPADTFMSVNYTADRLAPDFYIISITTSEQHVAKKVIIK